ncbi:MAG: hypothetical protein JOZ62_06590 [Acidobacteriaceae bacterium]|nr:hypothetical protein [Acidobacteriaceae bacterium]
MPSHKEGARNALAAKQTFDWYAAALLVLLVLVLGNIRLLRGRAAPQWDAVDFFGPQFSLVADHIKAGRLLLWDPWVAAGTPDFAEPELGATSPLLLFVGFLSPNPQVGFVAYWMLTWTLVCLGVLVLVRHLRVPVWGGIIAAVGFSSSGFYTGHAEHTSSIYSVSILPWIVWRVDAALLRRSYWPALQAGVFYGVSALGGYPEFTILTCLFLGLWTIGRIFSRRDAMIDDQRWRNAVVHGCTVLGITVLVGFLVCSPTYSGFLADTHGYSDRVGTRSRIEAVSSNILPAGALTSFSSPYLALLNMAPKPIWPRSDVSMTNVYVGSEIAMFSVFAIIRRSRWRLWLFSIAVFFAFCSLGDQLPIRGWLYDMVFPTRYFRNAALFRAYVILLLALLASLGAKDLAVYTPTRSRLVFAGFSAVLACAAIVSFAVVIDMAGKRLPEYPLAISHLLIVWLGGVLIATLLDRDLLSIRSAASLFVVLALVDAVLTLHISRATMYTEATLTWWHAMDSGHSRNLNLAGTGFAREYHAPAVVGTYPNNRNLPLKVATFRSYVTLFNRFHEQFVTDPVLSRMALGRNRIYFSGDPAWLTPNDVNFAKFAKRVHEIGQPVLVLHSFEQMKLESVKQHSNEPNGGSESDIGMSAVCTPASVSNVSYWPNSLAFRYLARRAGWLLVTDRWAPGWQLVVNGRSQRMLGADFIFRAVRVERGINDIYFIYNPPWFFTLAWLSWAIIAAIALVDICRLVASRRGESRDTISSSSK